MGGLGGSTPLLGVVMLALAAILIYYGLKIIQPHVRRGKR
jgi:zinc transporter ZupT